MKTFPFTQNIESEAADLARAVQETVVHIQTRGGNGSGIIWSKSGQIITNHHVMSSERAEIETHDRKRFGAHVVVRDLANDLAVLQAEDPPANLAVAKPGDSRALKVGQLVMAVGNPFGMRGALSAGIISAVPEPDGGREMLRADIVLLPGNSGGPLVDVAGRVIGVNAMVASPGLGLAVPVHVVQQFLGASATPKIGIVGRDVDLGAAAARAGLSEPNAVILIEVVTGSLAGQAGLLPGDVLIGINGRMVTSSREVAQALAQRDPSAAVTFRILRGGEVRQVVIPPARPLAVAA